MNLGGETFMWGYQNMMGGYGFGFLGTIFWLIILVDLILLGVWLWQKVQKGK